MLGAMRHNNRYSHGRFIDKECGLRIGWTCHPGSFAEGMPLVSEDGNTVMIFAGEDFGDRDAIARQRHAISSKDSAEAGYLLEQYVELGDQFFAQLNGWFSGVIVDRRSKQVTLFNDRYGWDEFTSMPALTSFSLRQKLRPYSKFVPRCVSSNRRDWQNICGTIAF